MPLGFFFFATLTPFSFSFQDLNFAIVSILIVKCTNYLPLALPLSSPSFSSTTLVFVIFLGRSIVFYINNVLCFLWILFAITYGCQTSTPSLILLQVQAASSWSCWSNWREMYSTQFKFRCWFASWATNHTDRVGSLYLQERRGNRQFVCWVAPLKFYRVCSSCSFNGRSGSASNSTSHF